MTAARAETTGKPSPEGKKESKDEITQRYLADFTGTEGVLYVGRAQEKATVWRTQRRYGADGSSYAWLVKTSALVNYRQAVHQRA